MKSENYKVINIRDYFQKSGEIGEKMLRDIISDFTCPLNLNVEEFLKQKSIEFTKRNQSVTYLVFLNDASTLVGYFTLASKSITIKEGILSKTIPHVPYPIQDFLLYILQFCITIREMTGLGPDNHEKEDTYHGICYYR